MSAFYDDSYQEPGLTTEPPGDAQLQKLLASGFKESGKEFTYHGSILRALGLKNGDRLLDYGASWGYASWQFARQGFDVTSFEISKPRAEYGRRLGLQIHTDIATTGRGFDAVYTCHVLEHTPNPKDVLLQQLAMVRPGGIVVGHTPNGSLAYRGADKRSFNSAWGLVHPVLLTDRFLQKVAASRAYLIGSDDLPESLKGWDGNTQMLKPADGAGLFFVIRRSS